MKLTKITCLLPLLMLLAVGSAVPAIAGPMKKVWIFHGTPTTEQLKITANAGVTPFSDEHYHGKTLGDGLTWFKTHPCWVIRYESDDPVREGWKWYEVERLDGCREGKLVD